MRTLSPTAAVVLAWLASACFSGGAPLVEEADGQLLKLQEFGGVGDRIDLELHGPESAGSSAVSYYIFGSTVSLGDHTDVPLAPQRQGEALVATLGHGESLLEVDLSPWAGYEFIYLRANPCRPQIIFLLRPGKRYVFSST